MKLAGRNAIITGASTGLGLAIASTFLSEGANIAICGRNEAVLSTAIKCLEKDAGPGRHLMAAACDVAHPTQVQAFVDKATGELGSVDILVNNAGVLGPIGSSEDVDLEEWRATFETNLFGVLHCCRAILHQFRRRRYGKIINLSGGGATSPRPFFSAYAASKAAVVRFTETLAEELRDSGIDVNAIAPGALNTRMLEQAIAAGPGQSGQTQFNQALRQKDNGGSSVENAARLCVYLASEESNGITGRLISAPWDAWHDLHLRLAEFQSTDIYTLRRIVPADRGKSWN